MHKILIIDDDKDIHFLLKSILSTVLDKHFHLVFASSGKEALVLIEQHDFKIIICDFDMRDGHGLFVLHELESRGIESAFFFFTSTPEEVQTQNKGLLKAIINKTNPKKLVAEVLKYLNS